MSVCIRMSTLMCTYQVRACALRRDALLDRAGLKLGHGVDEERSGCGNMDEGKERVRADGNEGD